jgi:hypothetical protein
MLGRAESGWQRDESQDDRYMRLVDVAQYLRVTKQRAHMLVGMSGFPPPTSTPKGVRLWRRNQIERWAGRGWWGTKPWRIEDSPRTS